MWCTYNNQQQSISSPLLPDRPHTCPYLYDGVLYYYPDGGDNNCGAIRVILVLRGAEGVQQLDFTEMYLHPPMHSYFHFSQLATNRGVILERANISSALISNIYSFSFGSHNYLLRSHFSDCGLQRIRRVRKER